MDIPLPWRLPFFAYDDEYDDEYDEEDGEETEEEPEARRPAEQFDIPTGAMMEVVDLNNRLIFIGRVESYAKGELVIQEVSGLEVPPVIYNDEYKLRCFQGCGSSKELWKLDRLHKQFSAEQRSYFRQQVKIACRAALIREPQPDENGQMVQPEEKPVKGELLDISAGGLLLKSKETFREGDRLMIREVRILPYLPPFSFTCQIRRARQEKYYSLYGCEFQGMTVRDQDRLFQAIFDIQRQEIRERRDR